MGRRSGWALLLALVAATIGGCGSDGDGATSSGGPSSSSGSSSGSSGSSGTPPNAVKTCAPACPVENLTQGAFEPRSLVVSGDRVYFFAGGKSFEDRGVYSVPAAGGPSTKLASAEPTGAACKQIATDGAYVYFVNHSGGGGIPSRLERVPVSGGPAEEFSPAGTPQEVCIALDDTHVYWHGVSWATGAQEDGIFKSPKHGGPPVLLAKDERPTSITTRGGNVYFATDTAVKSVPAAGGSVITLAGQLEFTEWRLTADDAFVYMADRSDGVIARVPTGGGPQEILAEDDRAWGLVLDGATLFWSRVPNTAADNRIVMLELGAPKPPDLSLAGVPIVTTVGGVDIAVDATHIYWASAPEGAIRRVAK